MTKKSSAEKTVRDIRRATRRHYSAEEKIRIVLEGLRGEQSIAELCRREGINTRGRPYHPQTQGKIERWHRSMKNQILLENYYLPCELQEQLLGFVNYYNHERYHESLENLTPSDVFYGRGQAILDQREQIKLNTLAMRRKIHYDNQAIYATR